MADDVRWTLYPITRPFFCGPGNHEALALDGCWELGEVGQPKILGCWAHVGPQLGHVEREAALCELVAVQSKEVTKLRCDFDALRERVVGSNDRLRAWLDGDAGRSVKVDHGSRPNGTRPLWGVTINEGGTHRGFGATLTDAIEAALALAKARDA